MATILPSASTVTLTTTSEAKPFAEAVLTSPSTAGSSAGSSSFLPMVTPDRPAGFSSSTSSAAGVRELIAVTMALEVTVAPDSTSAVTGMVWPMNWFRKASSSAQRVPKLGVSLEESTSMATILPSASTVTLTTTSEAKPFAEAVLTSPSTAGSSTSSATARELIAVTIALEVTVAPDSTSAVTGMVWPTN